MRTRVSVKGVLSFGRESHVIPSAQNPAAVTAEQRLGIQPQRTRQQLRKHYEIETELASRLRTASRDERRTLYTTLYDELYRRVADHPQVTRKSSEEEKAQRVQAQMRFLSSFLTSEATFLEVGSGDCSLSLQVARHVKQVYAVDVSSEITNGLAAPRNFRLCLSDGCSIPVPAGQVDVAYSNQLMEHLHPDDALEQLDNIYASLAPSGVYLCRTPNRLNGPHDISKYFDPVATGFHLREYTVSELRQLFMQAGFSRTRLVIAAKGRIYPSSIRLTILAEKVLERLGYPAVQPERLKRVLKPLLRIWIIGIK